MGFPLRQRGALPALSSCMARHRDIWHQQTPNMRKQILSICASFALGVSGLQAQPKQPFEAIATTTDAGSPVTVRSGGTNLFDFISAIVGGNGAFQSIDTRAYSAGMTFLGVPDAIRFTRNSTGTAVTMTLAPIGFNRTFTGPNETSVDDQIDAFFESEGGATIAAFLKAIAKSSPIAVTDGNPTAATAIAAQSVFAGQGFTSADEFGAAFDPDSSEASKSKFGGINLGLNAGTFEAGGFEGKIYDVSGTILNFGGEKVRFLVPINFNFLEFDAGSKVGGAGINLVLPIRFKVMSKENPWNWRLTPLAGVSVRGSVDLGSLSPLWQAGVVNTLDYKVAPKLVFSIVNQFTMHRSIAIAYDGLDFDPDIDQQILKNGVRFVTPLSRRFILDGFAVDTRFMKDAAVKQFWSFGGSLSFRATQRWNLVLGANYDTGDNFKAYSGGLSSAWKW